MNERTEKEICLSVFLFKNREYANNHRGSFDESGEYIRTKIEV